MTREELKQKLERRLSAELEAYEQAGRPDRVRLSRTQWHTCQRKQAEISRKISALEAAVEFLSRPIRDIDVHKAVLMSVPVGNASKEELLRKAESIYLNERKEALKEVFNRSLPILKQQVIQYL